MILYITSKFDPHIDYLVEKFNVDFFRLNTDDYLSFQEISVHLGDGNKNLNCIQNSDERIINLSSVKSAYYRRPTPPSKFDDIKDPDSRALVTEETKEFLRQFYYGMDQVFWLCTPWGIQYSRGRLNQLLMAERWGFKIPRTLFTSNEKRFKEFYKRCKDGLIIKTISSGACVSSDGELNPIYTEVIDSGNLQGFDTSLIENSPCLFQEKLVAQYEIRVTSVGWKNFAVRIDADVTDWRKRDANPRYSIYDLPPYLDKLITKYLSRSNLNFGCFDFIRTADGEYYFLELNPNGQWLWLELETGIPISNSVIDLLENPDVFSI